jgi:Tfp pilus assembly protein FimT
MRSSRRAGYTIMELLVVLVVLVILGAVLVPTLSSYYGNSRQKAAADLIRSKVVEARAKAMEQGIWYRVAINQDKTRIRMAPDGPNFSSLTPGSSGSYDAQASEDKFDKVTAEVTNNTTDSQSASSQSSFDMQASDGSTNTSVLINGGVAVDGDWVTVMTVGPEGICKEDFATVTVKEGDFQPILIQVRGLVGSAGILPAPKNNGSK